ncbi:MAG: hypothetical protein QOF78_4266, partial [Phycisphaerales bacterium]|jgi:hypothetical protein|nr:hypothetical protein [Phycisphaerales bacterium]
MNVLDPMGLDVEDEERDPVRNCQRFSRSHKMDLPGLNNDKAPLFGFLYFKIEWKVEFDFGFEECEVCCKPDGNWEKRKRLYVRARYGGAISVLAGFRFSTGDWLPGAKVSIEAGIKGEAWLHGTMSGELANDPCKGKKELGVLRVCGSGNVRLRLGGIASIMIKASRWFSWEVSGQIYGQISYNGFGVCLNFDENGFRDHEINWGKWGDPSIQVEFCFGGCYRRQLWP